MSWFCIECDTENVNEAKFCKSCGKKVDLEVAYLQEETLEIKPHLKNESVDQIDQKHLKQKIIFSFLSSVAIWFIFILTYMENFYDESGENEIPIISYSFYGAVNLIGGPFGQLLIIGFLTCVVSYFLPYSEKRKYLPISIGSSFVLMAFYGFYLFGGR